MADQIEYSDPFCQWLRVTDAQVLEVVRMVLLGQVNQGLVLMASKMGGKAIGLCGTDGGLCVRILQMSSLVSWAK